MDDEKIVGMTGDYEWDYLRDCMINELRKCQTKEDFLQFIESIVVSTGSIKELKKMRKALRMKAFKKEELKDIKKLIKK